MNGMRVLNLPYGAVTHFLRNLKETWSYSEMAGMNFTVVFQGEKKFTTFQVLPKNSVECFFCRSKIFNSSEDVKNERVLMQFLRKMEKRPWSVLKSI